jgi:serine/threonine-protein kinase
MLKPGETFGPFTIDKELGAGAMGAVYRAVYTKTGQRVALKIMLPGLDDSNPNAAARFEREAAILKQFSHPNIVRLFGVGKYHGTRYYAMEYVEGESLDRLMGRRDRMTWEEVAALGKQLCAALKHAHDHGVIHRDLKPSNLMILADGTLKLTDFGIAKDMDLTQLTSANCTVGTASYMSPEQCRGERNITIKSDLYSLGCVFYELVTGRKPFHAENAMEMFMHHVKDRPERPSRRSMDLPVWFDNLICQLMEKKPEHRPLDAAMVAGVLDTIQEKVATQKSAGVDVATRKRDRRRGGAIRTEEDREAARVLSGKPKRKEAPVHFYQRGWFVAAGALGIAGALGLFVFLMVWLWPRSSVDKLYAQAKPLMESKNPDVDWPKAMEADGPLALFEKYHADAKGEKADQMRQWLVLARKRGCEEMVRRYVKKKKDKSPLQVQSQSEVEEAAFEAAWAEEECDLARAKQKWARVKEIADKRAGWGPLADERLKQIADLGSEERRLVNHLERLRDLDYKGDLSAQEAELAQALRYQRFGDDYRAYHEFDSLRRQYEGKVEDRFWYLFAGMKAKDLRPKDDKDDKDERRKNIKTQVTKALEALKDHTLDSRLVLLDVLALYDNARDMKDDEIKEQVDRAKEGMDEVKKLLGKS